MLSLKPCNKSYCQSTLFQTPLKLQRIKLSNKHRNIQFPPGKGKPSHNVARASSSNSTNTPSDKRVFLTLEEAGLVEITGLDPHEKFLCRLTISSLNLLRVISEQEGCSIEELNAGKICDWFIKDKLKKEQNIDSSVLQWDESGF